MEMPALKPSDPDWYEGRSPWRQGLPWLTPSSVMVLNDLVKSDFTVMEFGSGGSTIFFGRRCRWVVSYESDPQWMERVRDRVRSENLRNVDMVLLTPGQILDRGRFDLILVDSNGRTTDREKLSSWALNYSKPNGIFVLDNYARYKLFFLNDPEWFISRYDDPNWDGNGTLIALKKTPT